MLHLGSLQSKHAILFLHGYNQTANDAMRKVNSSLSKHILSRIVIFFPKRKWFHYKNDHSLDYDDSSLIETRKYVIRLLNCMRKLYDSVNLIGYSQGACLALDVATKQKRHISVLSISGYLLNDYGTSSCTKTHIWSIHGNKDIEISHKQMIESLKKHNNEMLILQNESHWGFWNNPKFKAHFQKFIIMNLQL